MLSADYNYEQKELETSIPELHEEIDTLKNECINLQKFFGIVKIYLCTGTDTGGALRFHQQNCCPRAREKALTDLSAANRRLFPLHRNFRSTK